MSNLVSRVTKVIESFLKNDDMFTLLDVSEAVKADGEGFVRHGEVREVARPILRAFMDAFWYTSTEIEVQTSGGPAMADLFHPESLNPDDYVARTKVATAPAAIPVCSGPCSCNKPIVPPVAVPKVVATSNLASHSHLTVEVDYRLDGSIQIPRSVLKAAGIEVFDDVEIVNHPNSIGISLTSNANRIVNENFRISKSSLAESNLVGHQHLLISAFSNKLVISKP